MRPEAIKSNPESKKLPCPTFIHPGRASRTRAERNHCFPPDPGGLPGPCARSLSPWGRGCLAPGSSGRSSSGRSGWPRTTCARKTTGRRGFGWSRRCSPTPGISWRAASLPSFMTRRDCRPRSMPGGPSSGWSRPLTTTDSAWRFAPCAGATWARREALLRA